MNGASAGEVAIWSKTGTLSGGERPEGLNRGQTAGRGDWTPVPSILCVSLRPHQRWSRLAFPNAIHPQRMKSHGVVGGGKGIGSRFWKPMARVGDERRLMKRIESAGQS
jgi:hypothetical protein